MAPIDPLDGASVESHLVFEVTEPTVLALQIAVAASVPLVREVLAVEIDGAPVEAEAVDPGLGNRVHMVTLRPGRASVRYAAEVAPGGPPEPVTPDPGASLVWLRQSRYSPSDLLEGLIARELGDLRGTPDAAREVGRWVFKRVTYRAGASGPGDTAIDTLLHSEGVCRDFAHLTVAACRSLGLPARSVAVYAPGLAPMDFHAVAEVAGPDGWEIIDATRLAPRPSLVRIATGRDAADTALVTTVQGYAELLEASVTAVTRGSLPRDDHESRVRVR